MQEFDFATNKLSKKTTVLVGLDKAQGQKILEEIEQAIKDKTIDTNERLKVAAMRYAKYGDEDFAFEKLADKGYYVATNFPKVDRNNYKDINAIKKGIERLQEVAKDTETFDGIRADIRAIAVNANEVQQALKNNLGILAGYNDSAFDQPILNAMLLKWNEQYPGLSNLFEGNKVGFNIPSDKSIDLFGGVKLYSDYNPLAKLYGGANISDIDKIRGQEFLAGKHLANWFEEQGLRPHMAEDDVTALIGLFTRNSEVFKNQTLVDYINKGINNVQTESTLLQPNKQILRAKKYTGQDYGGKNYFNFAQSKSKGTIFTADNHMLGKGDAALEAAEGALKENFNTGFGINKGAFYDIAGIRQIELNDDLRKALGGIAPEYSGQNIFQVQLNMVVDDMYEDTRLGDLTQNLIFKSEKEMNAFLSGHFDIVGERTDEGIKLIPGEKGSFDIRELKRDKKGNVKFERINTSNMTDAELFQQKVIANNEKLLASRAENNMFRDKSYQKIKKALKVKDQLEETLQYSIHGKDISMLMSERVAKGHMAMDLSNEQIMKAKDIIARSLEYDKNNTKRVLDSSIDNLATGVSMITSHEKMLQNVINYLEADEIFKNSSDEVKQQLFAKTLKQVKREAADFVYSKESVSDMMQLGNTKLRASFDELKNTYEINYGKLVRGKRINFIDTANSLETLDVLKIDLSDTNSPFKLMSTAVNAVHGKNKDKIEYKANAIEKMYAMLREDKDLSKTKAFKDLSFKFKFKDGRFNEEFHPYQIAEGIIEGMKQVKSKNATKGIINVERAYMKAIEAHTGYSAVLNSDPLIKKIPEIVKNITTNTKNVEISGDLDTAKRIASNLAKEYYMPDFNTVKNGRGWNKAKEILYNNANNDITDYLTNVIYSVSNLKDTNVSIQNDGTLLLSRNGRLEELTIPKVKYDSASGTMFTEIGSMRTQLTNELTFKSTGSNVKGGTMSTLGHLNEFNMSANVRRVAESKGSDEALDRLIGIIGLNNNKIRQKATINGFGGNDMDSNNSVALGQIKNVLVDLFGENQKLNHVVNGRSYADKEFLETIKEHLSYVVKNNKQLEDINPEMTRDLAKNISFVLDAINEGKNTDASFKYLSKQLGLTGSEKRVSELMGVVGYRPGNSTFSIHDNNQRPPITQSGNALQLRIDEIKKSKFNIAPGNAISSDMMDLRTMREYHGIGRTTTDVMMDITYVNSSALQTLIDSNFEKVINNSSVDKHARKMKEKAYDYVRNSVSTFEQERVIDSRVHESAFGLRTANTQKLSKGYDIVSLTRELEGSDYEKQVSALLDYRGNFVITKSGELRYNSSHGKLVKRGESVVKWKGFGDINNSFASKMDNGVFNFNFYESDGTKLKDNEINKIVKENKALFFDENNKPLTQYEMANKLEEILAKRNIKGQYAIEDISAIGYAKTMTAGAEKGMTDIVYATTGSYDANVRKFFEKTGN